LSKAAGQKQEEEGVSIRGGAFARSINIVAAMAAREDNGASTRNGNEGVFRTAAQLTVLQTIRRQADDDAPH